MALIKCKACDQEISKNAKKCPNCGEPTPKKTSVFTWIISIFIVIVAIKSFSTSNNAPAKPSKPKVSDAECKKTIQCWGDRHSIAASIRCDGYVEKLAKYSYEWTDGILEPKFGRFRWKDKTNGIVTFIGDKIKFQNGFGAMQNYVYECDYNPASDSVLDVRGQAGRL
jgi:hypothetical protein